MLSHVIALHNASVRHHEGHLNVLDDASVALMIWQVSDGQLRVHLRNHRNKVVPEVQVALQGQAWDSALGDGEDAAVVVALSRDEVKAIITAAELAVCVLLPIVDVRLGQFSELVLNLLPRVVSLYHCYDQYDLVRLEKILKYLPERSVLYENY